MAVNTAPYRAEIEDLLRDPIEHTYRVRAQAQGGPLFDLAVAGELSVSFSLGWSPYAQASVTVKTPALQSERDALDGRLRTYVTIELGYGAPLNQLSTVARLRVQDVEDDYIAGTTKISLQGAELFDQDATWYSDWNSVAPRGGVREFITYVLRQSLNYQNKALDLTGTGNGYRPDLVNAAEMQPAHGTNIWSLATSVAASAGLKLWHDGLNTWRLSPRVSITSIGEDYATMLRTGKTGTVTAIRRKRSRSDWYNRVQLIYSDMKQANGMPLVGTAYAYSGPYGYMTTGTRTYSRTVSGWANQGSANAAAAALFQTLFARGDTYSIQAAAAYWVRPGMTVPVKTGRGPYERQLVESVTFTPLNGLMTIDTIKNEDAETA